MRVAVCALHFGKEYLAWAIRGIQDAVDEIHIHYAPEPSYGYTKGLTNPDSEAELREQTERFLTKPLRWFWVPPIGQEGRHRMLMDAAARAAGADMYIVIDADEVWDPATAIHAMNAAWEMNCAGRWLTRFANFWRSWKYQLDDGFMPIRIVDCRFPLVDRDGKPSDSYLDEGMQPWPVFHFGYAQTLATMRYKLSVHSHTDELRPGWLEDKFIPWKLGDSDCHPTARNLWTPRPTSPDIAAKLVEIMGDHPFANVDLIV